jgi:ribulose-bisphosphate carboxylase large chain
MRHGATVELIEPIGEVDSPSLTGRYPSGTKFQRGRVTIKWPFENIGPSLPNLLTAISGNLTELAEVSGIRLLGIDLPPALIQGCPGPQFSIEGTRRLAGVYGGPIVGTIIKPSVGLSPEQTAALVFDLALAGVDFVKDDELIASPPYSPIEDRVAAVMTAVHSAADKTGRQIMFAFNITGEVGEMLRRHDTVVAAGGTCVMVCLHAVGLAGVIELRRHARLPIHGHRAGWGSFTRHPALGFEYAAYQKLWRLAGVDQLHVNGLESKFWEPNASVAASGRACLEPLLDPSDRAMPVFSSAQWGGQAAETYLSLQSADLIYLAGGGIMGHPDGLRAGVTAVRDAWQAALAGIPIHEHALTHPELAASIAKFGRRA